jgi:hypothetical protein
MEKQIMVLIVVFKASTFKFKNYKINLAHGKFPR